MRMSRTVLATTGSNRSSHQRLTMVTYSSFSLCIDLREDKFETGN